MTHTRTSPHLTTRDAHNYINHYVRTQVTRSFDTFYLGAAAGKAATGMQPTLPMTDSGTLCLEDIDVLYHDKRTKGDTRDASLLPRNDSYRHGGQPRNFIGDAKLMIDALHWAVLDRTLRLDKLDFARARIGQFSEEEVGAMNFRTESISFHQALICFQRRPWSRPGVTKKVGDLEVHTNVILRNSM